MGDGEPNLGWQGRGTAGDGGLIQGVAGTIGLIWAGRVAGSAAGPIQVSEGQQQGMAGLIWASSGGRGGRGSDS